MVLYPYKPWMIRQLDYFNQISLLIYSHTSHVMPFVYILVSVIKLETMSVPLADLLFPVYCPHFRIRS